MLTEIIPGALQVPDYALWNIGGYVLSALIAGFSGYRWGLKSQIHAKRLEVKTNMLPLIGKFAESAKGDNWFGLRPLSIEKLSTPAIQLKSLLTGRKRKQFIQAWDRFAATTPDEFHVPQYDEQGEPENKMRQLFLTRLEALNKAVLDC